MIRPWARWRSYPLAVLALCSVALGGAAATTASEVPPADLRFAGLERLYFERLDDPAAATSSIRRGGEASPLAEDLRRLLPEVLGEGDGPTVEGRVIEPSIGPIGFDLAILDLPLPLPVAVAGAEVFLRQVVDGTHPRIHEQFWAPWGRIIAPETRPSKLGGPEASLDPPSDAEELCAGHLSGAPLPDGRPGPHITWTLLYERRDAARRGRALLRRLG